MAVPVHGLPAVLSEGMEVCVVPPMLKGERRHVVESCETDGREGALVSLSGVEGIDAAKKLCGRYFLVRESELPEGFDLHDGVRLLGREVVDEAHGLRGRVDEVMTGPANDVWVVALEDGGEVLLPVIDQVVSDVPDDGPIAVDASGFYSAEER